MTILCRKVGVSMSVRSDFYVIVGYDLTGCETEKYEDWEYTDEGEKYHCNQSKDKIQFFNDPMSGNYLYFGYILAEGEVYEFETTKFDVENINQAKIKVQDELIKLIISGVIKKDAYLKGKCHVIAFEEVS